MLLNICGCCSPAVSSKFFYKSSSFLIMSKYFKTFKRSQKRFLVKKAFITVKLKEEINKNLFNPWTIKSDFINFSANRDHKCCGILMWFELVSLQQHWIWWMAWWWKGFSYKKALDCNGSTPWIPENKSPFLLQTPSVHPRRC